MTKYYLGLDIGTNSIGWAVVDQNGNIVKKNGFSLWGVRMFDEAEDASTRRLNRSARRRLKRRARRIKLLREIFVDEIDKVDSTFFQRMDDSFYKLEDKKLNNVYNLFNDRYTDKEFFKDFPTIYHLRKHLCDSNEKEDIRFIYLALHNMIKFRGNFLANGDSFDKGDNQRIIEIIQDMNNVLIDMSYVLEDYSDYFVQCDADDNIVNELGNILTSKSTKTEKKNKLKKLFNVDSKTFINECFIPLLVGSNCNMSKLTPVKDCKYEKCDITLECEDVEVLINEKRDIVPDIDAVFDIIPSFKTITDHFYLIKLLEGSDTLSEAMIKKYDEHKEDLNRLKVFFKHYAPDRYNECFRIHKNDLNNYVRYIGMNSVSSKKPERFSHCKKEDFYKYLLSIFNTITNSNAKSEIDYFKSKIENNDFLLRQNSDQNGSIPMQLNLMEMRTILNKQSEFYPFLKNISDNMTNIDKIISIFKFVVPYYVGPLSSQDKTDKAWMVRKEEGQIYPWNFNEKVDLDSTETSFIQRMQRKCTYLKGKEDYCMPKNSIAFSTYNCLSYLNKLSINGALISNDLKMELFNNVFLKIKKPTKKQLYEYIKSNYGEISLTTTKLKDLPEINCDMSSYIKFVEIFGDITDKQEMIEQIIKDIVIFTDKSRLEKRLVNIYGLDKTIARKIKDLNYKDYCNISRKLINGIEIYHPETGEVYGTVLDVMRNTNMNLQEIMYHQDYRLIDIIDDYNQDFNDENFSIEEFLNENIAISPIMRRPLVQAYKIIEEVERILKTKIDKYYVECTRTNEKKQQTISRYDKVKELYKSCKELALDIDIDMNELNEKLEQNKDKLKSDLLYLYFTQFGRCMYSLEKIDFDALISHNNLYDIDHIYPQSIIKDDSLSNRVLVLKSYNNPKKDNFLFELENFLNPKCYDFYRFLIDKGLISKEKYTRLTKKELNPSELEVFVNRQIVATNQAVKGLIQTLKMYKGVNPTDIVYSKASIISEARSEFDWPKSRTANNFHHAHDAYLNVVIGKVVNDYYVANHFNGAVDYYRMKSESKTINPIKILQCDRYINGKLIWKKDEMIKLINKNLYERYDVKETVRCHNPNTLLSKVTILPAGINSVPVSLNDARQDTNKYGGYTAYSYSKYAIIKEIKKGKSKYILEAIPKAFEENVDSYLNRYYENYEIVNGDIKTNVVIRHNDLKYCVTGKTKNELSIRNLNDKFFNKKFITIIKNIEKYFDNLLKGIPMNILEDTIIVSVNRKDGIIIELNKQELIILYKEIMGKFSTSKYMFNFIKNKLIDKVDYDITKLTIENLIYLCKELLKLCQTNTSFTADLILLELSNKSGSLRINKNLTPGMKFISESVTGYYSKVLFKVPEE